MAIDTGGGANAIQGEVVFTGRYRSVITDKATYTLRATAAKLAQVIVWGAGTTWTLDFYDSTGGTTKPVWGWVSATGLGIYALQIPCGNGITIVSGGGTAGSATVVWD